MRRVSSWRSWSRRPAIVVHTFGVVAIAARAAAGSGAGGSAEIAALGSPEPAVREQATARLAADVAAAADALFAAAESTTDPEVAWRVRWLLDSLPLAAAHDAPEAAAVLTRLETMTAGDRRLAWHELLRLDGGAGIEPLARLVRLDRSSAEACTAAALVAGEWRPDDASWQQIRGRIVAGLGTSGRPAARFLKALAADPEPSAAAAVCADAAAAVESLAADGIDPAALRVFRRCLVALLARAGRRAEALAEADRLFATPSAESGPGGPAQDLVWLAAHGVPEAVDAVRSRVGERVDRSPPLAYACGIAERARGREHEADRLADAAHAAATGGDDEFTERLRTGMLLTRWGAFDWAGREYETVLDASAADPAHFGLAGIVHAESLHDRGQDAAAAAVLGRVLDGHGGVTGKDLLERLDREPAATRARMRFFESCACAARGDADGARRCLRESLRNYPQEVDALIALFRLPHATAEEHAEARALVEAAAARIDARIEALPEETDAYNEYAWLVANTVGDFARAERYVRVALARHARQVLEARQALPFDGGLDSPSYLDTLAHCRAAVGDLAAAIRIQSLAVGLEPHGQTLRKNLEAFRGREREARP